MPTAIHSDYHFDAADYAVQTDDCGDCTDYLGGWDAHKWEEASRADSLGARLHSGSPKRGRTEFSFPDESTSGWMEIARQARASEEQLQKAAAMVARKLPATAKRQAYCGVLGARNECISFEPGRPDGHKVFRRFGCKNRYCPRCGSTCFRELFSKYVRLRDVVLRLVPHWPCRSRRPDRVVAKIDFTTRNLGRMPRTDEVKAFNRAIKKFFRLVEQRFGIRRDSYGVLWCDEFGHKNTNLHAHGLYSGPWLPNRGEHKNELAELWQIACRGTPFEGTFIVSIKLAKSFEAGLVHALKYAGNFLSKDPKHLAELEETFHRVRRVHTLAGFYNALPVKDAANEADTGPECPLCGAALVRVGSLALLFVLEDQGYQDLEHVCREAAEARALGARPALPLTIGPPVNRNKRFYGSGFDEEPRKGRLKVSHDARLPRDLW